MPDDGTDVMSGLWPTPEGVGVVGTMAGGGAPRRYVSLIAQDPFFKGVKPYTPTPGSAYHTSNTPTIYFTYTKGYSPLIATPYTSHEFTC